MPRGFISISIIYGGELMNFHGQVVLVYLEEDNIARAYFRIKPLMTQDGPVGDTKQDFPDNGYLRIVPDRNEQHTFKERMRSMCGLCVIDLRELPPEANKIRTNKNYNPFHGETNQFIIYSDAVRALPENMIYQVVPEGGVATASTAQVYIRNGANIQGPFRREDGQAAGESAQLPPDSPEIHSVTVSGQELLFYWPKVEIAPTVSPAPAAPAAQAGNNAEAEESMSAEAAVLPAEAAADKKEDAPQVNAFDQIQALNVAPSANANRLRDPIARPAVDYVPEQPQRPLTGTRLYQTPQRQIAPRRAHNPLMEVVDRERYVGRYEAPGATLPQNTELKEVANPADALKRALAGMWQCTESQKQAVDVVLAHPGMRVMLAKAVAHEANDLTVAAMQSQLQELEAERLMTLMQLDDAKKNLSAVREEALGKLNAAEQKKLDEFKAAQSAAQSALDSVKEELEPLRLQAQEQLDQLRGDLCASQRLIIPALGEEIGKAALIARAEAAFRAAGFAMESGDAEAILTAYALSERCLAFRAEQEADTESAIRALAAALGVEVQETGPLADAVILPGGDAPVLFAGFPGAAHPLLTCCFGANEAEAPVVCPAVPIAQALDTLPTALPQYPAVSKACVIKAMTEESPLSEDTQAVILALRKAMAAEARALPLFAVNQLCRFVACTQNTLKGGVAEALDRAVCLYAVPYMLEEAQPLDEIKPLLAAMPRTLKALKACHE